MKKVRIGIVGLGRGNGSSFAKIYNENPKSKLIGICDILDERVKEISKKYNVSYTTCNYHELIDRNDIDLISIHTGDRYHAPIALEALDKGKHVFIEKPMATTIEDCHKIVKKMDETGLKVDVGFILRFNPFFKGIKKIVDDGVLGDIYYAEGDYIVDDLYHSIEKVTNSYSIAFVCSGTHPMDLLHWYVGEPVEVQAYSNNGIASKEMDDFIVAIYKFKNGCIGKVAATWGATCTVYGDRRYNIRLYGSKGTIMGNRLSLKSFDDGNKFVELPFEMIEGHPYDPEVDAFLDSILNNTKPPIDARDGGNSTIAILTAMDALKKKRPVAIPLA